MNMRGRSIIIPINRIVLNVVRMMMNVRRDHMMRGLRMRMWMVMDMVGGTSNIMMLLPN